MAGIRKKHTVQTKIKVVLEALKGEQTISQLTAKYGVHATQISSWKRQALEALPGVLGEQRRRSVEDQQPLVDELYRQIGQLKVELDWVKKKSGLNGG